MSKLEAQANGLGEESMPPDWLSLKGRDKPLELEAEANPWLFRPCRACSQ